MSPESGDLGRAWTRLREEGVAATGRATLRRLIEINRVVLLACPTTPVGMPLQPVHRDVEFHWLTVEEFDRWLAVPALQFPASRARLARTWLARGDRCLTGLVDGQPVTYLWLSCVRRDLPGVSVDIGRGKAYVYKTFTVAACRGRGLNRAALSVALQWCAASDIGQALIDVDRANLPSVRAITQAGFQPVGHFLIVRLLRTRRAWLRPKIRRLISDASVH